MPEPPVSPKLKELVLKHEKHAKESSNLDTQPRQKPKAKFRDSFILDTKDEGLYSNLPENGLSDCNSILRQSVKNSGGDKKNGDQSSANDQGRLGHLTCKGHETYRGHDDSDVKKDTAKVSTVTTTSNAGGKNCDLEITDTAEELSESDGNKVVKRGHMNGKFESIQKRFSLDSYDRDSRRSSKETNGYEIYAEESPQSTRRSSLVRGDSIKALQQKFQQAAVPSSVKQGRLAKSDSFCNHNRQIEEPIEPAVTGTQKNSSPSSFLDNSSKVTDVQDVLTRMRNADLIVENGDTKEDIEARTLLNKFLGASVILRGMEQGVAMSPSFSPETVTTTRNSGSIARSVENQEAQKISPTVTRNVQQLDNNERRSRISLESCRDRDQEKKIGARLREVMAEQKACADAVMAANGGGGSAAATGNDGGETIDEVTVQSSMTTNVSTETDDSSNVKTVGSSDVKTEVHTRTTTSSHRLTKANSVSSSPFAKFQQLERQNSAPNSQSRPCYKFTDPALARSASSIKDRLLCWVKAQTKEYKDLQITNFSTSWNDGLAFCALIHHFYPEAFDYDKLKPENRRENFEIAFKVAEDEAGIAPLLDVEDMVVMRKPDWKCVFTYVQTFYRRFHNSPQAAKPSF